MKINQKLQSLFMATALGAMFTLSSCDKEDPLPPPVITPTVVGVAQADTTFSILVAAVTKANLVGTLSDATKSYTVFAPTNNAFRAAGITLATIDGYSTAQVGSILTPLLTYHVLAAKVLSTGVPSSDTVKTLNGRNLFASRNANGVFLNGTRVATADINASNGVVHVIGSVLIPPTQTIAQIVTANPNFSLLLTAVVRGGLAGTLSGPGKFTVFAPINSGFPASLDTDAKINAAPVATVAGIVGSHAFGTNIFAGDLSAGVTGATVNPLTTLTIALTPAATVRITGSVNPASAIQTTNVVATNGVIHIIDRVLQ